MQIQFGSAYGIIIRHSWDKSVGSVRILLPVFWKSINVLDLPWLEVQSQTLDAHSNSLISVGLYKDDRGIHLGGVRIL